MARYPKCGWSLPPLYPKKSGKIVCPDCSSVLEVQSYRAAIRVIMVLFLVPLLMLVRIDDANSLIYALVAIVVFPLLFVIELATNKLTLAEENEL